MELNSYRKLGFLRVQTQVLPAGIVLVRVQERHGSADRWAGWVALGFELLEYDPGGGESECNSGC